MFDREIEYAMAKQCDLLVEAEHSRQVAELLEAEGKAVHPLDRALVGFGRALVVLGQGLQKRGHYCATSGRQA